MYVCLCPSLKNVMETKNLIVVIYATQPYPKKTKGRKNVRIRCNK